MSPVNVNEKKPLKVYCTDEVVKKYPYSFGDLNLGSNLGPILEQMKNTREKGYDDILFLINGNITELSEMNVFVYWENRSGTRELVTPELDGTVLPGITRDSVIQLGKDLGVDVVERHISIKEVIDAVKENRCLEIFGTSTLDGFASFQEINYNNQNFKIPNNSIKNKLSQLIYDSLLKIKVGAQEHPWVTIV